MLKNTSIGQWHNGMVMCEKNYSLLSVVQAARVFASPHIVVVGCLHIFVVDIMGKAEL
jgi:hypothetical protein